MVILLHLRLLLTKNKFKKNISKTYNLMISINEIRENKVDKRLVEKLNQDLKLKIYQNY